MQNILQCSRKINENTLYFNLLTGNKKMIKNRVTFLMLFISTKNA